MTTTKPRKITGWHVFGIFFLAFSTIIAVNLTLAYNAVATFPGLEVKNSYVASQNFNAERDAQLALNWTVSADVKDGTLTLNIFEGDTPIEATFEKAIFGRATVARDDQTPEFVFNGYNYTAPVTADAGNWNLRLEARATDGTLFKQRVIVRVAK
jgi:nitrogen fixation protein FixH